MRSIKCRARRKGLPFDLTVSDITPPEFCPVLRIKIMVGKGRLLSASPSVDRIDNSKGYTRDNIRVISHAANRLKSNMTIEQCERLLAYMKGELK